MPKKAVWEQEALQSEVALEKPHYHINPANAPLSCEQPTICTLWKEQDSTVTDLLSFLYTDHPGLSDTTPGTAQT